jgi:hypothetical protein
VVVTADAMPPCDVSGGAGGAAGAGGAISRVGGNGGDGIIFPFPL